MKKTKLAKMSCKQSGRQQETRITAYTVILSVIVLNILWWTGVQFISTDATNQITVNTSASHSHYNIGVGK